MAIAWYSRSAVEESRFVCEHDCLDAVAEVELLEDVRDVCLDGRVADVAIATGSRRARRRLAWTISEPRSSMSRRSTDSDDFGLQSISLVLTCSTVSG